MVFSVNLGECNLEVFPTYINFCNATSCLVCEHVHTSIIHMCIVCFNFYIIQGCLKPIEVCIPPGSVLDPLEDAAVMGGNILTSQRVVDVIFRAFSTCAASQGCMNNTTFGDDGFGYYETVAGGAGAVSVLKSIRTYTVISIPHLNILPCKVMSNRVFPNISHTLFKHHLLYMKYQNVCRLILT